MNSHFIKQLLLLLLLFTACAKQGMPPGGSADKTPPQIIRTIPPANATFVDPNIKVEIRFNEWLNTRTVEEAVFISPYLGKEVKVKIGGKKVKIIFPGPLKKDRTYVITLGTGIKDMHNNAQEKSFTLAFSTGGVLDKGEMKGTVYEEGDAKGIDVWAYILKDEEINPSLVEPDYIVQCGEDGDFHFTHIATGRYRLFAVKDRIADRRYTKGEDRVGVTYTDVEIPSQEPQLVDSLFFRMFFQDTLAPSLIRAVSVNEHLLRLLFDQPVFLDTELPKDYVTVNPVVDSLAVLDIKEIFLDPNDNKRIQVGTEPQAEETY
ncbi:MAG: Ig-like domain-containing protein, partial [bacterium]